MYLFEVSTMQSHMPIQCWKIFETATAEFTFVSKFWTATQSAILNAKPETLTY